MMQQESGLKRQVIDVGLFKILVINIHVENHIAVGGQVIGFHIVVNTEFVHVIFQN